MRSGSRSCNFRFWLTALAGYIKKHRNLITHFDFGQKLLESALFASICSMARNQNESKKKKKTTGKIEIKSTNKECTSFGQGGNRSDTNQLNNLKKKLLLYLNAPILVCLVFCLLHLPETLIFKRHTSLYKQVITNQTCPKRKTTKLNFLS